ncbi:hypothetical protein H8E50_07280 [bacterium]|nr:hypothetical protein [bacterium]
MRDLDTLANIAQTISFAFEDSSHIEAKNNLFQDIFQKYLNPLDPDGSMEAYNVIIMLGRSSPEEFERMIEELKGHSLI